MKKKFISQTYLRGVDMYEQAIIKDKSLDCYLSIKCINNIDNPYIESHTGKDFCLLDKGYYIVEYLPIGKNYVVRVFLDNNKEVVEYYIDVTKENGIHEEIPFYLDLYLDITIDEKDNKNVRTWDESELEEAVQNGLVTREDAIMAYEVMEDLLKQIGEKTNPYINNFHCDIIDKAYESNAFKTFYIN